jgi:hypothetical protein
MMTGISQSPGNFPDDVAADLENTSRIFELNPDMDYPPAGYKVCDATAARMMEKALDALTLFDDLAAEGHGSTHEVFKAATEIFATLSLLLIADRETWMQEAAQRRKLSGWKRQLPKLRNREHQNNGVGHIVLTEETVAVMKREAQQALTKHLDGLENLSRAASFEAYKVGAVQFAKATAALADDREGRKQMQLVCSSAQSESPLNSKEE